MYSTCIFCTKPFGANETLEAFPVGERISFDAKRGRLWVVCRMCERWNLSPLEERWEAVEQAERAYRDARRRVSTDNIGLAKLPDGTTLVRIGEPLRPEFAAWRYGDQFGRRRNRALLATGASVAAFGAIVAGGVAVGIGIGSTLGLLNVGVNRVVMGKQQAIVATIRTEHGLLHVRRGHLYSSFIGLGEDGQTELGLQHKDGIVTLRGRDAERAAAMLVPKANRYGGGRRTVATAVNQIESVGGPDAYIKYLAELAPSLSGDWAIGRGPGWHKRFNDPKSFGMHGLRNAQRLALEMSLHEEAERRAMEGELAELERAWRDAEEIAAIADSLTIPASVEQDVVRLKGNARPE